MHQTGKNRRHAHGSNPPPFAPKKGYSLARTMTTTTPRRNHRLRRDARIPSNPILRPCAEEEGGVSGESLSDICNYTMYHAHINICRTIGVKREHRQRVKIMAMACWRHAICATSCIVLRAPLTDPVYCLCQQITEAWSTSPSVGDREELCFEFKRTGFGARDERTEVRSP